jgi:hypothetical protein
MADEDPTVVAAATAAGEASGVGGDPPPHLTPPRTPSSAVEDLFALSHILSEIFNSNSSVFFLANVTTTPW